MNARQRKKNALRRQIKAAEYTRATGSYPPPSVMPLGYRQTSHPHSSSWRRAVRKMGWACDRYGHFAVMCHGIKACTWRQWCAALQAAGRA